jgi:hypothetical protein
MALSSGMKAGSKGSSLVGALLFFTGTRGLVSAISNPTSARSLRTVLDKEAIAVEHYDAFLALAQAGINALDDAGEYTKRESEFLMDSVRATASDWLKANRESTE